MKQNELKKQAAIVMLKIVAFFFVYLILLAVGGLFVFAAYYIFTHYLKEAFAQSNLFKLALYVIICGFLLLYGLYPLKFLFSKATKREKYKEAHKKDCPELFKLVSKVATATGNKMPKHIYLSEDVNATVYFDNTLKSILFPTRKNLIVGLGMFVNTNVEEVKSVIAHEFGHFAQSSMKIGSIIYYLNRVIYDMVFQENKWDSAADKYFRGLIEACRMTPIYGVIGYVILMALDKILFLAKDVLTWMFKFVNRSYFSLSRQMEFAADHVSCRIVGRDIFSSAMIKIDFAARCEQDAKEAWAHLLSSGKHVLYYDVFTEYVKIRANDLGASISYDKLVTNVSDLEECHSEVSFIDVFSDHPSLKDRIKAVKRMHLSTQKEMYPAWSLVSEKVVKAFEEKMLDDNYQLEWDGITDTDVIPASRTRLLVKRNYEGVALPNAYRPFFQELLVFDVDKINVGNSVADPFTDKNRSILNEYYTLVNDKNIVSQLFMQDDIKYASYKGKVYPVDKLPLTEIDDEIKASTDECVNIQKDVYSYLVANSYEDMKNCYLLAFEGIGVIKALNDLDRKYAKMRHRLERPIYDEDNEEPDDFWDLKYEFGNLLSETLCPIAIGCEKNLFPACIKMGTDKNDIDKILKFAKAPKPDYTVFDIYGVLQSIDDSIEFKNAIIEVVEGMVNKIKRKMAYAASEIEKMHKSDA